MTDPEPLGSVVIPAHNEAAVIRRCLDSLLDGFRPGELDVVVACNGCTDKTAEIVRSAGYPVRVVEIDTASKTAALRAAEETLTTFPRLYLDADVVLTADAARCVLERLSTGSAVAARPPIKYYTQASAPIVRSYYQARARVPSVMTSLWGAGVFGLSEKGRARFGSYPDVIADDLFVDQHFERSEIEIVDSSPVIVNVPRRTADLFRILRRMYQGNSQQREVGELPESPETTPSTLRELLRLARTGPVNFINVNVYISMACIARLTLIISAPTKWQRDNSSRSA